MEDLEGAYNDALNAEGSAMRENDAYLDSVQGRMDLLSNSLQTMWMNFLDSDVLKFIVDLGTGLIQLIDKFGVLKTLLMTVGTMMIKKSFGDTFFAKTGVNEIDVHKNREMLQNKINSASMRYLVSPNEETKKALDQARAGAVMYEEELKNVNVAQQNTGNTGITMGTKIKAGFETAKSSAVTLWAHLKQIAVSMAISYVITTVIGLVSKVIQAAINYFKSLDNSWESLNDKYKEASNQLANCESELKSLESELETTNDKIEELMSQDTLSFVEQEELERLQAVSAELERQISMTKTLQSSLQTGASSAAVNAGEAYLNTSFSSKKSKTERQEEAEEKYNPWGQLAGLIVGGLFAAGITAISGGSLTPAALAIGASIGSAIGGPALGIIGSAWEGNKYDQEQTVEQAIATMNESRDKLIKARDDAYAAYVSDPTDEDKLTEYKDASNALSTYDESMANHISQMSQYYNTITNNWSNATDKQKIEMQDQIEKAKKYGDMLDKYNIEMGGKDAKSNAINRIFGTEASEEIQKVKIELEKMAASGDKIDLKKAFGDDTAAYDAFVDRLYDMGIYVYECEDAFKQMHKEAQKAAEVNFTDIAKNIDAVSKAIIGIKDAFAEFLETGHASTGTLLDLAQYFDSTDELKALYEKYVGIMLSGKSSIADAQEATRKLVQEYLDYSISVGDLTATQKQVYITQLRELGIKNAEEFIDNELQQAVLKAVEIEFNNNNGFVSIDKRKEMVEQYGIELKLLDQIITKLHEKKNLEENRDSAQDNKNEYDSFFNDYNAAKVDYELLSKKMEGYSPLVTNFDTMHWLDYPTASGDIIYESYDGKTRLNSQEFAELKKQYEEYVNVVNQYHEALGRYKKLETEGIDKGYLNDDGSIKDGVEEGYANALKEAEDAVKQVEGEIDEIFKVDVELTFTERLSANTLSSLTNAIEQYKTALKETSEVVADGQVVTEEYKASLIELGISQRDLSECFDESNPLVVKNADALNKLVKDAKQITAQNIKLAKSQARLKYYEKYKELQALTKGQKVTTAATINQVKAIYAEMTAIQKSISRYSMLEHQLLGATNAYEKFADAQEIDAANDYESKAEELVGYLVDAFQTGKLGTESAQAAIMGLVPESVYEDLDTLDDKMAHVYKYFTKDLSKYFYVKFNDDGSLESAEMLVDNVKQFVEDGIKGVKGNKGVFTGSWENGWDLAPHIDSLDELAEQMNVTKEVAYAFLNAMETYDISWIGGDASTLLDRLVPNTTEIQTMKNQIQEAFNQSPIDLTARLNIGTEKLEENGYTGYSTTFNSSDFGLYNEDGSSFEILATPVLPNGDILGKDELSAYIKKEIANGKTLEETGVLIGKYVDVETANEASQTLDEALKHYNERAKSYNLENAIHNNIQKQAELEYKIGTGEIDADTVVSADGVTTASQQLTQLREESEANAKAARENATAWIEARDAYEDADEAVKKCKKALEDANKENDPDKIAAAETELQKAGDTLWDTYEALAKCGEPTEVILTVAKEQVQKDLDDVKATMNDTELDIVSKIDISNLEQDKNGDWIVNLEAYSNLNEEGKEKVQKYLDYLAEEHKINLELGEDGNKTEETIENVAKTLNDIAKILQTGFEFLITDNGNIDEFRRQIEEATQDRTTTVTVVTKGVDVQGVDVLSTPTLSRDSSGKLVRGYTMADGTAHVGGTAYAGGNWGVDQTETALTGELGPEILVRNGRWTTVGENGAEFTQVKKGDIIFNHKQSEQLLKHGYVTGRGKAYASGTAYAPGSVHTWLGGMGNIDDDWKNIVPTLWDDATNGEYLSDALEETIDWIEVRMEEFDKRIGQLNAELENLTTYAAKNAHLDKIIAEYQKKYADSLAGATYYEQYAQKYLEGMNSDLVEAAKNGAIAISEFTKEQDEATVKAIQNYRDYSQKAADLYQQAEEILTDIRNSVIQKIDNIQSDGSAKTSIEDLQTEKLQNKVDYLETKGEIPASSYYGVNGGDAKNSTGMFENSYKKIEYWQPLLKDMQTEFDEAVRNGQIEVGGTDWYEQIEKLYQVQAEIDAATIELEEFQNAINDIYWDNFDQLINRLDYLKDETQGLIDLMDSEDMIAKPEKRKYENGTVEYWTADDVKWTEEGLATMGLYAQQMEMAEYKSRQYAEAIDDLTAEYKAGHYSENEYLEKLNELKSAQYDSIEAYYDAQDAIKDLQRVRIDSIKEGIEKEVEAYEELIEAKKEALDAEKDLYDFQKNIRESTKDIADLERQIAALATDNSASARAKRAQLQAELAEAQQTLDDTYYDRSIENQQNALDKELENFQDEKDAELEKLDEYLTNVEQVVMDSLNVVQENADKIGQTLNDKTTEYNLTVSDAVLSPWQDGALAISDYQETFDTAISSTMDQLELLKSKWQEVINTMAEASNTNIKEINQENKDYIAAKPNQNNKQPTKNHSSTNNTSSNNTSASTIKVGGKINAGSAKIYEYVGDTSGAKQYYAKDPVYKVLAIDGNWVKVRHHKSSSGVTGWFKKGDIKAYAKGSKGIDEDQLALIDELGDELQLVPGQNGRLAYVKKGTGIIPSDLTERLMNLAIDPQSMLDANRPSVGLHPEIHNTEINLDITYGDMVSIGEFHGDNIADLEKMVEKQFEKHTRNLNNALRRYTR